MRFSILVIVGLLISGSAMAEKNSKVPVTVQELMPHCNPQIITNYSAYCSGMALGIIAVLALNKSSKNNRLRACRDGFVSNGQVKQAFVNWANQNPQHWQIQAVEGMIISTATTWPCK